MRFKDVAVKNFKKHIRKYTSYFLCSSFAVMMFFVYSTLIFNNQITDYTDENDMTIIFTSSIVAIILFSVMFINYAHTSFIKSRYKEFGLYMTLGMTKNEIRKIVIIENSVIMLGSTISGILTGLIFSRLFQMAVAKIISLSNVSYSLDYRSFAFTLAVFALIFAVVIALSIFSTRRLEISELMKEARKHSKESKSSLVLGILGVIMLIISLVAFIFISNDEELKSNLLLILLVTVMSFSAEYLIISHLGTILLRAIRNRTNAYLKNILIFTEISYKFRQGKKVLFILTVLSAMIVFCVASPFSLYSLADYITEMGEKGHIEYVEISGINSLSTNQLHKIINGGTTPVRSEKSIEFLQLSFKSSEKNDKLQTKPVISESTYNSFFKANLHIPDGQAVNIITDYIPGYHGIKPAQQIRLKDGFKAFDFIVKDSFHADQMDWITGSKTYPSCSGIIISDNDFQIIKNSLDPKNIGIIHSIKFKEWKKTQDTVSKLKTALSEANLRNKMLDRETCSLLKASTMIDEYNELKKGYSLMMFVMSFIGALFFVSAGSVLFFKQYTELNEDKQKFFKLYKIGITEQEVRKIYSRELLPTFFAPPLLGSIIGYALMYLTTHMVGGQAIIKEFMTKATIVVVVYFAFQTVFYVITKRKFVKEII
ncbi:MAG TPA: ABC transporter permease [Clostridia bacterium]|nr:ABC transporter permease [Clostridia bacterium]